MPPVDITETFYAPDRASWRAWLEQHHASKREIWLLTPSAASGQPRIAYLASVEEALCFGWIDGIAKRMDDRYTAQRFTPRRSKSNWTELNKERARRLIAAGQMTPAGLAVLPDLLISAFRIAPDIMAALQSDPVIWANFQTFPDIYQRVRVGYIEEQRRNQPEFRRRLENFLAKTRENKQFGVWG